MEVIKLKVPEKIGYDGEGDYLEVTFSNVKQDILGRPEMTR